MGSSPVMVTGTCGLIAKRSRTVDSFTGRVNVSWKVVTGATWLPLVCVATIVPAVSAPDWNAMWIPVARLNPSWSVAAPVMSTR